MLSLQAKRAETEKGPDGKPAACLPLKGGVRVAAAELAKGDAADDPASLLLLAGRPELQHLAYCMQARHITVPEVRQAAGLELRPARCAFHFLHPLCAGGPPRPRCKAGGQPACLLPRHRLLPLCPPLPPGHRL